MKATDRQADFNYFQRRLARANMPSRDERCPSISRRHFHAAGKVSQIKRLRPMVVFRLRIY